MSAINGDGDFGTELCKVLGLDPKKTKNIVISCKADDAVKVHVTGYLQDTEVDSVLSLIKKYRLEEDGKIESK